jgi:hypothetical protein
LGCPNVARCFLSFPFLLAACSNIPDVGLAEGRLNGTGVTPNLLTAEALAALSTATQDLPPSHTHEAAALQARAKTLRQR